MSDALRIAEVSHSFGSVKALDDVSLHVAEGAFTALLGVNGAGKTTLFSLVTRLYDSVSGTIEVCGHDLRRAPMPALAKLGIVFQSRALDADLTVAQNLAYHAALHGMGRKTARARAELVLAQMGLSDKIAARVSALSGGQARRAECARALMHGPRLLLLDEPTVGLDVQARRDLIHVVRALVARDRVGVLWATHLLDEIEPQDAVVVLHRGRILRAGRADGIAGDAGLASAFLDMTGLDQAALA